jgi:hypothetical protein
MLVFLAALLLAPAVHARTLTDLAWLKGCWRTQGERSVVTEVWLAPPMPALLGYSYTIGEGEMRGWEQTRIEMIDGWPHFVAMPNGEAAVRFRLREESAANLARFDNPAHDYPQTVEYRRDGNWLIATISGAGGADPFSFRYRRIRCPRNLRP